MSPRDLHVWNWRTSEQQSQNEIRERNVKTETTIATTREDLEVEFAQLLMDSWDSQYKIRPQG